MSENAKSKLSSSFLKWVVIVLLVLIVFQMLNGGSLKKVALFEGKVEFFEEKQDKGGEDRTPSQPQTTSVGLAYTGDVYGCTLPLTISIGEKSVTPQSNVSQMPGVELGNQPYSVSGQINCPMAGSCQASGQGIIDVTVGRTFNIVWQNTGVGMCTVLLQ